MNISKSDSMEAFTLQEYSVTATYIAVVKMY
jgi:hypothetical protein